VVENLPRKLYCNVLILHGRRDKRTPVGQAIELATALKARGAHVSTDYFPQATHDLGARAKDPVAHFLRETLVESSAPPAS
jgi:dipeptidyl aminopeptidase/acylaminoacyl peptidase